MDNLEIIREVRAQHKVIFGQLDSAQDYLNDMQALLRLEKGRSNYTLGIRDTFPQKREELEKIMNPLEQGLRKHYSFEEEYLPPLLGDILTDALIFEHKQLLLDVREACSLISHIRVEGLTRAERMEKDSLIYDRLDSLRYKKLDHLNREESILLTLENLLENRVEAGRI